MKQETSMIHCRDEFSLIWREIGGAEEEKNMCQSHLGFRIEGQGHAETFVHFSEMRRRQQKDRTWSTLLSILFSGNEKGGEGENRRCDIATREMCFWNAESNKTVMEQILVYFLKM
jgi:hypothetical protein